MFNRMSSSAVSNAPGRRWLSRQRAVSALVTVGLAGSLLVSVSIGPVDGDWLPGVALESPALLVVERTLAFFAAWLVVLVVGAQALQGRLPTEISGRGVRYADAQSTQATAVETEGSVRAMRDEIAALERTVLELKAGKSGA